MTPSRKRLNMHLYSSDAPIDILLVDDRPENLISLAAVLDRPDYRLIKANSGKEALKHILETPFALILMDVQMPGIDGFETAELIKKREKSRNIPIIFITAISTDAPFIFKGYDAGAVDYIMKPFDPGILRSKVAVFAELHRKNLELRHQSELVHKARRLELEQEIVQIEMRRLREQDEANRKFRDLVNGIHQGIVWTADAATFKLTFISHQIHELLGFVAENMIQTGRTWTSLIHPEDLARTETSVREIQDLEVETRFEHRFVRADGRAVWFQTGIRIVHEPGGAPSFARFPLISPPRRRPRSRFKKPFICAMNSFRSLLMSLRPLSRRSAPAADAQKGDEHARGREAGDRLVKMVEISSRQVERLAGWWTSSWTCPGSTTGSLKSSVRKWISKSSFRMSVADFRPNSNRLPVFSAFSANHRFGETGIVSDWQQIFINLLMNAAQIRDRKADRGPCFVGEWRSVA